MASRTATTPATGTSDPLLTTVRAFAVLTVVTLLWQFVTAGQLFPRGGPEELHSAGAHPRPAGSTSSTPTRRSRATTGPSTGGTTAPASAKRT